MGYTSSGLSGHRDVSGYHAALFRCDTRFAWRGAARAPLCADPSRPSSLLPFTRRCRFNPFGRPLGVCMAMHYSSNNERAARIVAYPKEGNATALNVRFLRPRRGTPIHYIGSWALSRGPYWPYSWAPRDMARKYDVLIPVRSDAHGCSRIPCSSLLVLAFVTWGLALSQRRQLTWIADNPILSLPLSLRN